MKVGFYVCIALAGVFLVLSIVFALLGEKGAMLVSGFNTLPKSQRGLYDQGKISSDMRNALLIWTGIMGVGAVLSYTISSYCGILAFIIWLILFLKDFHWDAKKAFEKYKK